jgi:prefoldin subunit 5
VDISKRISALFHVSKIAQNELDILAKQKNELNAKAVSIQAEIDDLNQEASQVACEFSVESAPYIGDYLSGVKKQKLFLSDQLGLLDTQIATLQDKLVEKFLRNKAYENTLRKMINRERTHAKRKETFANDEIAANARYFPQFWS